MYIKSADVFVMMLELPVCEGQTPDDCLRTIVCLDGVK